MADEAIEFRKIEERSRELKAWISSQAPQCFSEQKHLEEGSQERGYWAHGYLSALEDVVQLLTREIPSQQYGDGEATRYAA